MYGTGQSDRGTSELTSPPAFPTESKRQQIDLLLTDISRALQLTSEQRARADCEYKALGDWLDRPDSALHRFRPQIYPQGSMAYGTTTKPVRRDEYDLDAVVELAFFSGSALELFGFLRREIANSAEYAKRIELLKRCVRINFPGLFHIDVLPARKDLSKSLLPVDTHIEVPDRELRGWISSNPKAFCAWFEGRCDIAVQRLLEAARDQQPLPAEEAVEAKAVLKQVVQLLKRQRCIEFAAMDDQAPRSVVLTTLAGHAYAGERSLLGALLGALDGIVARIQIAGGKMLEVLNPTNPEECFSEAWRANPTAYPEFVKWVTRLRPRLATLEHMSLAQIGDSLEELFGQTVARRAVSAFAERLNATRERGHLRMRAAGLTTTASGIVSPAHRFYGKSWSQGGRYER